jgi:HAMP domain-containing protein
MGLGGLSPRRNTQIGCRNMAPSETRPADALDRGEIDAVALVSSWESPVVRRLVAAPGVSLDGFPRADAYVALDPSLEKVVLPQGVGDLARNRPPRDVPLLALKVSLVVPRDVNPAIQYLLLDAASDIHGGPGVFHRAGQFPAAEGLDLPLGSDARHFFKSGRPFLQRYLPYWVAVLVERLLLVLLPILGLMVPIVRLVPLVYNELMEKRITRLYGELKILETELEAREPDAERADLTARLDELEARANQLRVPAKFSLMRYTLKQHIELVRGHLGDRPASRPRPSPSTPITFRDGAASPDRGRGGLRPAIE